MVDLPWRDVGTVDPEREYVALISYLPLRGFRGLGKFIRYFRQVQAQLAASDGLIGYTMRAKFLRHKFWTLSVWRDESALVRFVGVIPHATAMDALQPYMGPTKFMRWQLKGSAGRPTWQDGLRRLGAP